MNYYDELIETAKKIKQEQLDKVEKAFRDAKLKEKSVYIIGNGGSASTAEHTANDFVKIAGLRACSLTNLAIISAYANDISYEDIFAEQLKILLKPGDIVVAISGSGNSKNIIKALEYAKENKAITIAFLGFDGGKCKEIADYFVHIESNHYGIIEDLHLSLDHYFAFRLKES